jgi:hypothetical protein
MAKNNEREFNFDDELAKEQPDYLYEGAIPEDNDEMDYVKINIKGVRLG